MVPGKVYHPTSPSWLNGIQVMVSPHLPFPPTHTQDARRIVRHGMRDVLEWLGEDVGPLPGDLTHVIMFGTKTAITSREWWSMAITAHGDDWLEAN